MTAAGITREMTTNLVLDGLRNAGVDLDVLGEPLALVEAIKDVPVVPPDQLDDLRVDVLGGKIPHDKIADRVHAVAASTPERTVYNQARTTISEAASAKLLGTIREHAPEFQRQLSATFAETVGELREAITTLNGITDPARALAAGDQISEAYRVVTRTSALLDTLAAAVEKLPDVGYGTHGADKWAWYVEVTEDMTEVAQLPQPKPDPAPLGRWHAWITSGHALSLAEPALRQRRINYAKQLKDANHNPYKQKMTPAAAKDYLGVANVRI